jgi:hypothetical protein
MAHTKVNRSPKKAQPQVRVTKIAHRHLGRIIEARNKLGMVENHTRYVSELILAQPIPTKGNGSHPLAAAEVHQVNTEAQQ